MGFALLQGWLALEAAPAICVIEPSPELRERLGGLDVAVYGSVADLPDDIAPDIVVFAVKPQMFAEVLPHYARWNGRATLFVSIAAGVTIDAMTRLLGSGAAIVRCMPNTPAAIGHGVMAICANRQVGAAPLAAATLLLEACGTVVHLDDEALMDAVTAVSGSGPAYVFHFIEALAQAGREVGLPRELAALMAIRTVEGAARLAAGNADDPATLRRKVTSPGGTTAAALEVLMGKQELSTLMAKAVRAARDRSVELGQRN